MILVNIARSGRAATTDEEVCSAASGDWAGISDRALEAYGDVLLAVQRNVVRGAYRIEAWSRVQDGRVRFALITDAALTVWVGRHSPVRWKRGQVNPVSFVESEADGPKRLASTPSRRGKPRRGVHRITIETKGLTDTAAARLHHGLITLVGATGHLHDFRTTSLVREIAEAKEDLAYDYGSAPSPPPI